MKKSRYIIILVILLIVLFAIGVYLHNNIYEGLTSDVVTQKTTNNTTTTNMIDFNILVPSLLDTVNTLTFIVDPAKTKNTSPRVTISNINFTHKGQAFDMNGYINSILMNVNTIDIIPNSANAIKPNNYDKFPGKVVTKVSDNSAYQGTNFNEFINLVYVYFKNKTNNINIVRTPYNTKIDNNAPDPFRIKFNNNFRVTVNGLPSPLPFDVVLNTYLNDVTSIDVTTKDLTKINELIDKSTKAPLSSTIQLKN